MNHPNTRLAAQITVLARDLGLAGIGFSPALPPARIEEFRCWLDSGFAGTMTYLNRSRPRRSDPRRILPGAKTVISVADSYHTERLPDEIRNDPARGLIAAYAWGQDYHDILLDKLRMIEEFIHVKNPDSVTKSYVDTGHILEREFAEQGGLGFVGKNTMLIHPTKGSSFFLGEILTTLELPPTDHSVMPSCGFCTRCLDVCPTHALPAAHVLDSNRCISYLTIEFKGIIPRELRSAMGNHVFGCDDCQDCCPWNQRFSKPTQEKRYSGAIERQAPLLTALAVLSESEFKEKFRGSAVLRPRYAGFMRNVAVALGNWRSPGALDSLEVLLRNESPLVRLHAVWAVGQIASSQSRSLLKAVAEREEDSEVICEVKEMLSAD